METLRRKRNTALCLWLRRQHLGFGAGELYRLPDLIDAGLQRFLLFIRRCARLFVNGFGQIFLCRRSAILGRVGRPDCLLHDRIEFLLGVARERCVEFAFLLLFLRHPDQRTQSNQPIFPLRHAATGWTIPLSACLLASRSFRTGSNHNAPLALWSVKSRSFTICFSCKTFAFTALNSSKVKALRTRTDLPLNTTVAGRELRRFTPWKFLPLVENALAGPDHSLQSLIRRAKQAGLMEPCRIPPAQVDAFRSWNTPHPPLVPPKPSQRPV